MDIAAGVAANGAARAVTRAVLEKAGITLKKIAEEIKTIAFSSIDDYVKVAEGGEIEAIAFDRIKPKKLRAVRKVKEKSVITESKDGETLYKTATVEYELYDKMDALKYLCKLRGDEPGQKVELTGADGGPINTTIEVIFIKPTPEIEKTDES
jgi:hypothetical protein